MKIYLTLFIVIIITNLSFSQTLSFNDVKKSAEQGDAGAQNSLGLMYCHGNGTLTDKKQAAYWIKKAYENGAESANKIWEEYELWKYQ